MFVEDQLEQVEQVEEEEEQVEEDQEEEGGELYHHQWSRVSRIMMMIMTCLWSVETVNNSLDSGSEPSAPAQAPAQEMILIKKYWKYLLLEKQMLHSFFFIFQFTILRSC